MKEFFRTNAIMIAVWVLTVASMYGAATVDRMHIEARLKGLEATRPTEIRWIVDDHAQKIDTLSSELRDSDKAIASINAQIGIINNKLDTIIDSLKRGQ